MKTRLAILLGLTAVLSGCTSPIPKDSLVRGLKIGSTPWTPTVDAEVIATGTAAKNLTDAERRELLAPKAK
jgi:hypothetical protein